MVEKIRESFQTRSQAVAEQGPGVRTAPMSEVELARIAAEATKGQLSDPKYVTLCQAAFTTGLCKSTIYKLLKDPKSGIRTKSFCTSANRRKTLRLVRYDDLMRFMDGLPEDL